MFQSKSARMFQNRPVREYQRKSADRSQERNARRFPDRSVRMYPSKSAAMFQDSPAPRFPSNSVTRFPNNLARMFPSKTARLSTNVLFVNSQHILQLQHTPVNVNNVGFNLPDVLFHTATTFLSTQRISGICNAIQVLFILFIDIPNFSRMFSYLN